MPDGPAVAVPTVADESVVPPAPRPGLTRAALVVAPATMAANVLGYAFTVVVSRALGPDGFGALGALLGLLLIGAVPALALQAVAARRVAVGGATADVVRPLVRASLLLGLGTSAVLLVAAPALEAYLRLDGLAAAVWVALSLAPLAVVSGAQGVLQGAERFAALAVVFVTAAALRVVGGVVAVLADAGVAGVLAATTAGSVLAAALALALVGRPVSRTGAVPPVQHLPRELVAATSGLLALVAMANVDVLLARHHLAAEAAGLYAVGAVLAKVAFWAPQAVAVVVLPRLAGERGAEVLRAALLCVGGFGAALVAGAALLAGPVLRLVFGDAYAGLAPTAWAFTALGAALAVAHLLVVHGIAVRSGRLAAVLAGVVVVEVLVISLWRHDSLEQVVLTALTGALVVVAAGLLLVRRRRGPLCDVRHIAHPERLLRR